MSDSLYSKIYQLVKQIPEGQVATYGQIGRLIGRPNHARHVGYALAALKAEHAVPLHRVINAKGEISGRAHPDYEDYQRLLLEDEGIEFGIGGKVSLKRYQWDA